MVSRVAGQVCSSAEPRWRQAGDRQHNYYHNYIAVSTRGSHPQPAGRNEITELKDASINDFLTGLDCIIAHESLKPSLIVP